MTFLNLGLRTGPQQKNFLGEGEGNEKRPKNSTIKQGVGRKFSGGGGATKKRPKNRIKDQK